MKKIIAEKIQEQIKSGRDYLFIDVCDYGKLDADHEKIIVLFFRDMGYTVYHPRGYIRSCYTISWKNSATKQDTKQRRVLPWVIWTIIIYSILVVVYLNLSYFSGICHNVITYIVPRESKDNKQESSNGNGYVYKDNYGTTLESNMPITVIRNADGKIVQIGTGSPTDITKLDVNNPTTKKD